MTAAVPHVRAGEIGRSGLPKPGLTGDSHRDLTALADWCQAEDLAAGNVPPNPGAGMQVAAAPPLLTGEEHLRLRGAVADAIVLLGRLLGPGVVEQLRRDYDEVASQAWTLDRLAARYLEQTRHLGRLLDDAIAGREHARGLACALEAELAQWREADWLATYTTLLETRVTETERDWCVGEANRRAAERRAAGEPVEVAAVGMLPVVDDHTLPEHALQFRAGDRLVAVGRIDRLFGPLDTATEIALGADEHAVPGEDATPLDDLEQLQVAGRLEPVHYSWDDGTEWVASEDTPGVWVLLSCPNEAGWVAVAPPLFDDSVGSLRVRVGRLWGPYGGETPRPHPPGPPTPPAPAHNPVA